MSVKRHASTYVVEFTAERQEPLKENISRVFGEVATFLEQTPDELETWVIRGPETFFEPVGSIVLTMRISSGNGGAVA